METLVWIVAGAALGWAAYSYFGYNEARGAVASACIGAAGALVGGKAVAPIFLATATPAAGISVDALLFAAAAAVVFVFLGNFVYRRFGL
jgi:uncharacterized membrane protein YeaQ/YmgE (transglycosylase-associated protein family)